MYTTAFPGNPASQEPRNLALEALGLSPGQTTTEAALADPPVEAGAVQPQFPKSSADRALQTERLVGALLPFPSVLGMGAEVQLLSCPLRPHVERSEVPVYPLLDAKLASEAGAWKAWSPWLNRHSAPPSQPTWFPLE